MQTVDERFRELFQNDADQEVRVWIVNTTTNAAVGYYQNKIIALRTTGEIFASREPGIGGVIERTINLTVLGSSEDIPRNALLRPQLRLKPRSGSASAWIRKGYFYVSTREENKKDETVSLVGYDCLRKTGADYVMSEGDQGHWPQKDINVVKHICSRIGSSLDSRTAAILTKGYMIPYPGYGEGALTMRDVLGAIGSMYCGNWITTDAGQLYLVCLGVLPEESYYLIEEFGDCITIGGVRILVG